MVKIVVVDDEFVLTHFLAEFFRKRQHQVFEFTDPVKALPVIIKEQPEIILLDIVMPGMSGLELLREIRAKSKNSRVLILSVNATEENKKIAKELGAVSFIGKPFTTMDLEKEVMLKIEDMFSHGKEK